MKKLISLIITLGLLTSTVGFAAYAEKGGNGNSNNQQVVKQQNENSIQENDITQVTTSSSTIVNLKAQLKENHKDKVIRKELIKQIVELRRQNRDTSVPVFVYGEEVILDTPPVIKLGRMVVPVRPITNALGAEVQWEPQTQTITVSKDVYGQGMTTIVLVIGNNIAKVNGKDVEIGAKAEIINNRTMVPIRFIAETLKQKVDYDADAGAVIIDEEENSAGTTTNTTTSAVTVQISN